MVCGGCHHREWHLVVDAATSTLPVCYVVDAATKAENRLRKMIRKKCFVVDTATNTARWWMMMES